MKKTNTKEHAKDTAREIEELKSSEYFQTMTGAEKDRAIANHEREMRARKYTRPLWKSFFRTMPHKSFVADTLFDKRDSGEDTAPIHKDDHPLVSGYGAPGLMAINAGFYCEGEDHLLNVLDKMGTWLSCELLDGEPKSAANLTPKHYALLELDNALNELVFCIEKHMYSHRTVGAAIQFGALMMRLGVVFPDTGNADVLKSIEQMREQISAALETHKKSELMQGPADDFIFRQDGDVWRIRYDGRDLNAVRDSDGMTYIRTLLSNKLPVHFANLYREAHPAPPEALANPHAAEAGAIAAAHGTGGKIQHVYDADYLKQMRDRVADIESRLTNPELSNKQQEHLEDELEKLTAILKQHSATRHAGGITAFKKVKGSCTRQAIAHAIKTAIERIVKVNPQDKELAKHLKHGFKYGTEPHYIGGLTWA